MKADSCPSICFISPFMGPLLSRRATGGTGGAERQFYLFGTELARRGWRVVFIADCPEPCAELPGNVGVIHVPFRHIGGPKARMPVELSRLFFALRRAGTRYYAVKTAPHLAGVVCVYRLLFRAGLVMWGQTTTSFDRVVSNEPGWLRWIRWWGIRVAAALVAQTGEQAERALRAFGRRAHVVPNITVPPVAAAGAEGETGYVFWCGNDSANKRAEVFLEVARRMPRRRFVMAMNGDVRSASYRSKKVAAGKIANLRFLGSVPPGEIDACFGRAAVLVNTSVREGFPNAFLQAWQQGRPVISVNVDPERNLEREKLGICLCGDDSHLRETAVVLAGRIVERLEPLLGDPAAQAAYRETCRRYVASVHAAPVVVDRFIGVIREVEHAVA